MALIDTFPVVMDFMNITKHLTEQINCVMLAPFSEDLQETKHAFYYVMDASSTS